MIPGLSTAKLALVGLLIAGGGVGWYFLGGDSLPPATPLDDLPDLVHDRVVAKVAEELPEPGPESTMILPPIGEDRADALRTRLALRIDKTGRYEVKQIDAPPPESWWEEELLSIVPEKLATTLGLKDEADLAPWLLEARVIERQDDEEALALSVVWHLRDLRQEGRRVATGTAEESIERSLFDGDYLRWRIADTSPWGRGLLWFACVLIPWLILRSTFIEVLRKESNGWNAALWLVAATPGIAAGYVLTAFGSGWGGGLTALVSIAVTVVFSYGWLNWLDSTRR